jgi:hypothetical protein
VIAWSSFLNIKDPIVQFLTIAALYCATSFFVRRNGMAIVGFIALIPMFYWIRFYLPFLMLLAVACWIVWQWRDWRKYPLIGLAMAGAYLSLPILQQHSDFWNVERILDGTARFVLTPLPWSVLEGYSYLTIPSILHMLFIIPAAFAAASLWRQVPMARLYLIYFVIVVALYAITEDLQGPRQRFQIAFIFTWIQFHFLWSLRPNRQANTKSVTSTVVGSQAARRKLKSLRPAGVGTAMG